MTGSLPWTHQGYVLVYRMEPAVPRRNTTAIGQSIPIPCDWPASRPFLPFYSILEVDNPEAYEILTTPTDQINPEEGQEDDITEYLTEFSENMQQGFMMLRKDRKLGPFDYVDFDIELHVLNEKRFKLSHPDPPKPTDQVDLRKVNSILRPTLPDGMLWNIRTAW